MSEPTSEASASVSEAVNSYIMHHVVDSQEWHLPLGFHVTIPEWTSLHALMLIIAGFILFSLFVKRYKKGPGAPSGLTNLLEMMVLFIRDDVCIPNLGSEDGRKMAPLFLSFFFFILTLNLMGLVPLFAGASGNVSFTAGMAAITLGFMFIGGFARHGPVGFIESFIPGGVPWPVLVLVVPLEIMGLVIKCFALTIRLFANMFAGHIVILSLLGLIVMFGASALPALGLAVIIYIMKIFIALLQAYIFTLLSALFIGQVYHPSH